MRVFMLGWEFPPFISGGLGTACYGLTRALSRKQVPVTFVLPKAQGSDFPADHEGRVKVLAPQAPAAARGDRSPDALASRDRLHPPPPSPEAPPEASSPETASWGALSPRIAGEPNEDFANVTFRAVPARFTHPYPGGFEAAAPAAPTTRAGQTKPGGFLTSTGYPAPGSNPGPGSNPTPGNSPAPGGDRFCDAPADSTGLDGDRANLADYSGDLIQEARRYAALCVDLARGEDFDVIHAHDWLTFPAGIAVAAVTGKPLVVHVHSTEFDRAGEFGCPEIMEIERRGVRAAQRVIAVSRRTKRVLQDRYGVRPARIDVVYNGIENGPPPCPRKFPEKLAHGDASHNGNATANDEAASGDGTPLATVDDIPEGDRVVLFLGRITMQKGPEYFVGAAERVLQKMGNVTFVMAGSGDMAREVMALAGARGLGEKVLFTGFLRGDKVDAMFQRADVFVMPSVSEPFGIAPLEAIRHEVPVIISKTSGVAEVLDHALKVDFWDVDGIANKVVAVLRHPALSDTLRHHADQEARRLTWEQAAKSCMRTYQTAAAAVDAEVA